MDVFQGSGWTCFRNDDLLWHSHRSTKSFSCDACTCLVHLLCWWLPWTNHDIQRTSSYFQLDMRHETCAKWQAENRSKLEFLQDDMLAQQAKPPNDGKLGMFFLCQHGTSRRSLQRKGTKHRGWKSQKNLGGWTKTNPEANAFSC